MLWLALGRNFLTMQRFLIFWLRKKQQVVGALWLLYCRATALQQGVLASSADFTMPSWHSALPLYQKLGHHKHEGGWTGLEAISTVTYRSGLKHLILSICCMQRKSCPLSGLVFSVIQSPGHFLGRENYFWTKCKPFLWPFLRNQAATHQLVV